MGRPSPRLHAKSGAEATASSGCDPHLNIAAVLLHRWPDPRLQQLFDHCHRLRRDTKPVRGRAQKTGK
jgi:hypothetical protein